MTQNSGLDNSGKVEILKKQEGKLRELLIYLSQNSLYYQSVFSKNNLSFLSIQTIDDLYKIPVTTKDDLHHHNEKFFCVPRNEICDFVTTSGTMGDPVTIALTSSDLDRLADNECFSINCAGLGKGDVIQLMTTLDRRFMAGMAYFLGARKAGCGIVRVGNGIPELQWDSIKRFKPNTIIAVPSFILKLIEFAESRGISLEDSGIKKAICIGEPIRRADFSWNTLGEKITDKWKIDLYSTYASTEMQTAFTECSAGKGGHLNPELIIVEFLNEENQTVKENEPGELTITTLGVEGMPLLRFKTGDICFHFTEPCICGRNTLRLGPVIGRRKQMLKYKGTTLYPPALFDILDQISFVKEYIIEAFTNEIGTDEILVRFSGNDLPENFEQEIQEHFRAVLRVAPPVRMESMQAIMKDLNPTLSRKPVKFIDKRNF